jgi:crossover junction endodeoxyribonuclease RusA
MKCTLPYPPTANLYWRHARGRTFLSADAKAFKLAVGLKMRAARAEPIAGPVRLAVSVYRPRKAGDLDNTLKVLCDALNGYAWNDDKQIVEIHARRFDDKDNPRVEVDVEPAP